MPLTPMSPDSGGHIQLLDGGLGTVLEGLLGPDISSSPLWSTQAIIDHPQAIVDTHIAFLRAGARIIETSTYQAFMQGLKQESYSFASAKEVMLQGVRLAQRSKIIFIEENPDCLPEQVSIALALGPFGATLRPTQEFLGYYPPPYGPKGTSNIQNNCRSFANEDEERSSIDALTRFHLERLLIFCSDPDVWNLVDYIAFETVLLETEVNAIRKAMGILNKELLSCASSACIKPWWISFVFPAREGEIHLESQATALTRAAFEGDISFQVPAPTGIGVNCTSLQYLPRLIPTITKVIGQSPTQKPCLILYPNGGVYDDIKRRWIDESPDVWARKLAGIAEVILVNGNFTKLILGGCCSSNPTHVEALRKELSKNRRTLPQYSDKPNLICSMTLPMNNFLEH